MVPLALRRLRELIASADSDSVSVTAIRDLLDRVGLKAVEKIEAQEQVTIRVEYADTPLPDQVAHTGVRTNGKAHVS